MGLNQVTKAKGFTFFDVTSVPANISPGDTCMIKRSDGYHTLKIKDIVEHSGILDSKINIKSSEFFAGVAVQYPLLDGFSDLSSNGNNLNEQSGVSFDKDEGAYLFNGSNSYARLTTPVGLPSGNNPWSVMAWGKALAWDKQYMYLVCIGATSSTGKEIGIGKYDGNIRVVHWNNDWDTGFAVPPTDEWFHVAATFDGTNEYFYFNGVPIINRTTSLNVDNTVMYIGTWGIDNQWAFNGYIRDTRVYNYPLTDAQILDIYNGGDNPAPTITLSNTGTAGSETRTWTGATLDIGIEGGVSTIQQVADAIALDANINSTSLVDSGRSGDPWDMAGDKAIGTLSDQDASCSIDVVCNYGFNNIEFKVIAGGSGGLAIANWNDTTNILSITIDDGVTLIEAIQTAVQDSAPIETCTVTAGAGTAWDTGGDEDVTTLTGGLVHTNIVTLSGGSEWVTIGGVL